jgi:SAM-dependent methyltransferase
MNNARMKADVNNRADLRSALRRQISDARDIHVAKLVEALTAAGKETQADSHLEWFATQLSSARRAPDLLRELFRTWLIEPPDDHSPTVMSLRQFFGWREGAVDFDDLRPDLLDVIYLLPPRDYAVVETLLPVLEHIPSALIRVGEGAANPGLLDVGTGTGVLMRILRASGVKGPYVGIDPARRLARYASETLQQFTDVKVTTERIEDLQEQHPRFQQVVCYMVLHHVSDQNDDEDYRRALRAMFDQMEEGGVLVYTDKLWAIRGVGGTLYGFDFITSATREDLESGQELEILPAELDAVRSFQPHPKSVPEYQRTWKDAAEKLSHAGFLIERAKPLNECVFQFVCRKPQLSSWRKFALNPKSEFPNALERRKIVADANRQAPYQWTFKCLAALYEDITGETCPDKLLTAEETVGKGHFLRGIAYFSWEKASRLFLVRRARPFDFHVLSYSHVHAGWGSLGRMVEEFEADYEDYIKRKGYTCLTRDAVQRTLPFLGDIDTLRYEAAMAVPIYRPEDHEMRGAFLLYLAKREYVPLHTGSLLQADLVTKFQELNRGMNDALDWQEEALDIQNSADAVRRKWEKLVQAPGGEDLVIAKLSLELSEHEQTEKTARSLSDLGSRIQALLSSSECFSVLDERQRHTGKIAVLVAARFGLAFDDIRDNILSAVGAAAEGCSPLSYRCCALRQALLEDAAQQ